MQPVAVATPDSYYSWAVVSLFANTLTIENAQPADRLEQINKA